MAHADWDETHEEQEQRWCIRWLEKLEEPKELRISRCIRAEIREDVKSEVHVLCDASEEAFAGKVLVKELTIPIRRRRFWTDSSCVRNWLRTTASHYNPFVSHRIGEIQTLTESGE